MYSIGDRVVFLPAGMVGTVTKVRQDGGTTYLIRCDEDADSEEIEVVGAELEPAA